MMLSPVQICMDSTDWPQSMMQERVGFRASAATATEDLLSCSRPLLERGLKPPPEQALKCPRCDSTNTKFCYYNNYSLSQPRHFCKTCRRYWTKGGALRTVPVGGGCRKNKKAKRAVAADHSPTLNEPSTSSANLNILNPATTSANTNIFFNSTSNTSGLSDMNAVAAFARVQHQAAFANCNNSDFLGLSCGPTPPNSQSSFALALNPISLPALNALHSIECTFPSLANEFPVLNSNKSSTDQGSSSSSSLIPPSEWQLPSEANLFAADSNNFWPGGVWPDLTSYIASSSAM